MRETDRMSEHDCIAQGHLWQVGDGDCLVCRTPWSEVYDIVKYVDDRGRLTAKAVAIDPGSSANG